MDRLYKNAFIDIGGQQNERLRGYYVCVFATCLLRNELITTKSDGLIR